MKAFAVLLVAIFALGILMGWFLMVGWGILAAKFGFTTITLLEAFVISIAIRGLMARGGSSSTKD